MNIILLVLVSSIEVTKASQIARLSIHNTPSSDK